MRSIEDLNNHLADVKSDDVNLILRYYVAGKQIRILQSPPAYEAVRELIVAVLGSVYSATTTDAERPRGECRFPLEERSAIGLGVLKRQVLVVRLDHDADDRDPGGYDVCCVGIDRDVLSQDHRLNARPRRTLDVVNPPVVACRACVADDRLVNGTLLDSPPYLARSWVGQKYSVMRPLRENSA
jgi:hypothetical protein